MGQGYSTLTLSQNLVPPCPDLISKSARLKSGRESMTKNAPLVLANAWQKRFRVTETTYRTKDTWIRGDDWLEHKGSVGKFIVSVCVPHLTYLYVYNIPTNRNYPARLV